MELAQPSRDPHAPAVVAKVTPNLAHHGGNGEPNEAGHLGGVESVDGVHQPQARDLGQVLEVFAAAREVGGHVVGQGQASGHDAFALPVVFVRLGRQTAQHNEHLDNV